jgi:hypothetical protein
MMPDFVTALTDGLPDAMLNTTGPLVFVGLLIWIFIGHYWIWHRAGKPKVAVFEVLLPLFLHGFNFFMLGASLWCVTVAVFPVGDSVGFLHAVAIFTTAWIAGFVMLGLSCRTRPVVWVLGMASLRWGWGCSSATVLG